MLRFLMHHAVVCLVLAPALILPAMAEAQWGPPGYRYREALSSSVRLDITPEHAVVFVDGYRAGQVDDFDGVFQRLRLRPGEHRIVITLAGHRTLQYDLYLNPGMDQRIEDAMAPLGPGETAAVPPPPTPRRDTAEPVQPVRPVPDPDRTPARAEAPARLGTVSLRVQPGDAEIQVDGERWIPPADQAASQDVFAVRLREGRHTIQIRKAGFVTYTEDVLIREGRTLSLTVTLKRSNAPPSI